MTEKKAEETQTETAAPAAPSAPAAQDPAKDKEFADWLGALVQGREKAENGTIAHFVGQLTNYQRAHAELSQKLSQGQQELLNARNELAKIEGRIEEGVMTIRHLRDTSAA